MKIKKVEIFEDKEIDKAIRQAGLRSVNRKSNVSLTYISELLQGTKTASEKIYKRLLNSLDRADLSQNT